MQQYADASILGPEAAPDTTAAPQVTAGPWVLGWGELRSQGMQLEETVVA